MIRSPWPLLALALLPLVAAQESGWQEGQVNATICKWELPRVGVVRDTAYIDGGYLWWSPGMEDGTVGQATRDAMTFGHIYKLNFSTPFHTSDNLSDILGALDIVAGAANNLAPLYYDGALLANDGEFIAYGGLLTDSIAFSPPDADEALLYQLYWYGGPGKDFKPGPVQETLKNNVTRYVAYGGSVSVPSENKGYYFSGMRSASHGPVYFPSNNSSVNPTAYSNALISVDMTTQQAEVWANETVSSKEVPPRANPEVAWVPVGEKGVLVVIGGVVDPVYAEPYQYLNAAKTTNSAATSPGFLTTVSVYDIASKTWYQQATTGGPDKAQWAQGCTVVASAADGSSHNIYFYGGFDGIFLGKPFNDDVWILSLPSFTWIRAYAGTSTHGRAGHRCVKPYPDQMIVLGGYPNQGGIDPTCLENGPVQIFNLSSLKWTQSYDPRVWSEYTVPSVLTAVIGGTGAGGATLKSPAKWTKASLSTIFTKPYDTKKITSWYPYAYNNLTETNTTRPTLPSATPVPSGGGTPRWLAPVLGTVLTLIFLSALAIAFLLYRRRRYLKHHASVASTSEVNRNRILSWVWGHDGSGGGGKAQTVTSDDTPTLTAVDDDATFPSYGSNSGAGGPHSRHLSNGSTVPSIAVEIASEQVHELADTSRIQELSAAGLSDLPPTQPGGGLHASPSVASTMSGRSADGRGSPVSVSGSEGLMTPSTPRPDSPTAGLGGGELDGGASAGERRRSAGIGGGLGSPSPGSPGSGVSQGSPVSAYSVPGSVRGSTAGGAAGGAAGGGVGGSGGTGGKERTSAFGEIMEE